MWVMIWNQEKQRVGWLPVAEPSLEVGEGTVCSNGFYADISNQHEVQQYKSCLKSFLQNFDSLEVPQTPPWANIFDTDISRCINTYRKIASINARY